MAINKTTLEKLNDALRDLAGAIENVERMAIVWAVTS